MQITEQTLRAELKSGLSGVYLLAGEEEYLKHYYLTEIRRAVLGDGGFDSFNHTQINYLDGGFGSLAEAVGMTPFMAERRLCELSGFNYNSAKENMLRELRSIVDEALEVGECVLVLYADTDMLDAQKSSKPLKKVLAALGADVKLVVFDKTTPQKLANWIKRHFAHDGIEISDADCYYMVERCGRSMQLLSGEIDKVCAYKHARGETAVTREDINTVCPRNEEIGSFALSNALLASDTREIFRILGEMRKGGSDFKPKAILASISSTYYYMAMAKMLSEQGADPSAIAKKLKIHEYRARLFAQAAKSIPTQKLEDAVALCARADTDMKLLHSDAVVLDRLLCEIAELK